MRKYWIPLAILAAVAVLAIGIKLYLGNIHIAAQMGNAARITKILEKKPELVNTLSRAGRTPLHYAANGGHIDAVKALLANGANVEAERTSGFTPLHDAIVKKQRDVAELLIAHGAKIHGEMSAAYVDKQTVQLLIDLGGDVNQRDKRGMSPLDEAALHGNMDVLQLLLNHGADVNTISEYGSTPLHYTGDRGEAEAAKLLIQNGAEVNAKAKNGDTPLCRAIRSSQLKVTEVLLANGADVNVTCNGTTLLHMIAAKGKPYKRPLWTPMPIPGGEPDEDDPYDIARLLINSGMDVNAKDERDRRKTPLHEAAARGTLEVAKLLLEHGADVNAKDEDNSTPLHEVASDNVKMAELLLENGADLNVESSYGTPLELADNKAMIELFSKYKKHK
ncbi:MAG: ankyrin repeat domain-containing protein [Planctomycetota bacterium]